MAPMNRLDRSSCLVAALLAILIIRVPPVRTAGRTKPAAPDAVPREVQAACDQAAAIAAKTPGVTIRRSTGMFSDEAIRQPVLGCRLQLSGSFARAGKAGSAADRLRHSLSALGWQEITEYAADGKDGTAFAFRKAAVACLVRGEWNGGADGVPEIPREDWYRVSVLCTSPVPARAGMPPVQ